MRIDSGTPVFRMQDLQMSRISHKHKQIRRAEIVFYRFDCQLPKRK